MTKTKREKTNINKTLIVLIVFLVLLIFIPSFIHIFSYKGVVIGEESYYHLRISETLSEKGFFFEDDQIIGGRQYNLNPH
ncbi:hypothetical protein ACFL1H_07365, partial [Nanoarchaeota archaeon]